VTTAAILVLRGLLVLITAGLLAAQGFLIPSFAAQMAYGYPEVSYLQVPFAVVAVVIVVCAEVVVGCIWLLLSRVRLDRIFDASAFPIVDAVIASLLVAATLFAGMFGYMFIVVGDNNPGAALIQLAGGIGGFTLALLMLVMRSLLQRATQLQHDLSEVV